MKEFLYFMSDLPSTTKEELQKLLYFMIHHLTDRPDFPVRIRELQKFLFMSHLPSTTKKELQKFLYFMQSITIEKLEESFTHEFLKTNQIDGQTKQIIELLKTYDKELLEESAWYGQGNTDLDKILQRNTDLDEILKRTLQNFLRTNQIDRLKLAVTDLDGILRGKYVSNEKFLSAVEKGFGFCDVIFGWDSADQLYTQDSFTGWEKGFPDAWAHLDLETHRFLPLESKNTLLCLADFSKSSASSVCPRSLLKRILTKAKSMGFRVLASAEFEFFLFQETSKSIREKDYKNLKPYTLDMFGYSILRSSVHDKFYHDLMDLCQKMQMPLEGIHTETGPGVLEAALQYQDALKAADDATLFKTFTKVLAQKKELMATFMAKWSPNYPGQSGHLHISLQDLNENSVFYDESVSDTISQNMRWFIGGQQKLMPELLCLVASTCNSYTRLIPGFWAPTDATWGIENRTCALRAITGSSSSQRVEYRVAAADINPYLAFAAAIASGLWGIENQIEPTAPVKGNAYAQDFPEYLKLPNSLEQSASLLRKSQMAHEWFGTPFVEHFAYTREWEASQPNSDSWQWQLQRYFEII